MQLVRTWSFLVFPSLLFCFYISCADFPWFSFSFFLFLFWLINRTEGIVWSGWMTNLLCLFRFVWRQGAGHSWRTQGGDGSLGSKVTGGLAGRTWLYYSYHKLRPLYLEGTFVSFCLLLSLGALFYCVCNQWCFRFFPQLVFFKYLLHRLQGGGTTVCFSYFFTCFPFLFFLLFRFVLFALFFSSVPFGFLFNRMWKLCLSYPVWWHGIALPTAVISAYVANIIVALWRSFVTTELVTFQW